MIFAFAIACSFFYSFLFFLCTFCTGHLRCHFSLANRSMCGGGKGMWCVGVSKHNAYLPSTSPCLPAGLLFRQPISFYYLLQLVFGPRQASRPGQEAFATASSACCARLLWHFCAHFSTKRASSVAAGQQQRRQQQWPSIFSLVSMINYGQKSKSSISVACFICRSWPFAHLTLNGLLATPPHSSLSSVV